MVTVKTATQIVYRWRIAFFATLFGLVIELTYKPDSFPLNSSSITLIYKIEIRLHIKLSDIIALGLPWESFFYRPKRHGLSELRAGISRH